MAAPVEDHSSDAAEIRQRIARYINCLGEKNRMAKRRALENIRKETLDRKPDVDSNVLQVVFSEDLQKPLLKCFSDPMDKCRELSIQLVSEYVDVVSHHDDLLPYLIPCMVQRLGQKEIIEPAEELRFNLIEMAVKLITKWRKHVGPYVNDLIIILQRTLVDPFADVRKESCKCTCNLAKVIPEHFHLQSESLINPLLQSSSHQHSKVRAQCIYTLGDVLQFGNPKPMEKVVSHLAQRLFDDSPAVRRAVTEVVGSWLLDFIDRYSYHHKLIPLLLTSHTDEIPELVDQAKKLWDEVGQKYLKENEEELKDQINFEVQEFIFPPGHGSRPNLGCRTLIFRNFSKILPGLLNDLTDWTVANRMMSSRLLGILVLNAEDHTTQHLAKLLPGLYRACGDDENEVVKQVLEAARLVGFFVGPEVYCKLMLPTISSSPSPEVLMTLSAMLEGSKNDQLQRHLQEVCAALTLPEVCHSDHDRFHDMLSLLHSTKQDMRVLHASTAPWSNVSDELERSSCRRLPKSMTDNDKTCSRLSFRLPDAIYCLVASQLQLLTCTEAIMSCCGAGCQEVSFQLFYILVCLLALMKEEPFKLKVRQTLHRLGSLQGMDSTNALFEAHAKEMLDSLKGNYQEWGSFSVQREIFDTLLLEAGHVTGGLLDDIIPVLSANLHPDKDPELRLKLFSLLSRLVVNAKGTLDSQSKFGPFVVTVVQDMILPNCVWHGGRTAAAIRTTAVSCLWALLQSRMLSADELLGMMSDLLPQINNLLEDDVRTTRLVSCRVLQHILAICGTSLHPDCLHTMYMDLLKRLDDSSDEVRLAVAKTFVTYFSCFPKEYDTGLYRAHLEALYRGLLVHMDDPDSNIQQAVLDVLKQAAVIHPPLLEQEVEAVKQKHRSLIYCDELLHHIKTFKIST